MSTRSCGLLHRCMAAAQTQYGSKSSVHGTQFTSDILSPEDCIRCFDFLLRRPPSPSNSEASAGGNRQRYRQ